MSRSNGCTSAFWIGIEFLLLILIFTDLSDTVNGIKIPPRIKEITYKPQKANDDLRLPTSVIPEHYKIRVIPYIYEGNFTFDGEVTINVRCDTSTSNVTLNIHFITIDEGSVTVQSIEDGSNIQVSGHEYDEDKQLYIIQLNEALQEGSTYAVYIKYLGLLTADVVGFYRSSYTELSETKWLAVTDFESTDFRRMVPGFDEPAMKARFEISVGRDTASLFTAISNMDLKETVPMDGRPGWVWDNFNVSPPMSTYLVAILVSEFANSTSSPELSNALYRIWARKDLISQAVYANDVGPKILTAFENYFNIPYPLSKQDLVALPEFLPGAMENWGLITFRESALLYDPSSSTARDKYGVTTTIAHETAHEWTGDLVTCKWWSNIWLNEGFANFLQFIAVNDVFPDWHMREQFLLDNVFSIMNQDNVETSHPIIVNVSTPEEIETVFDGITYSKGASIIRMMEGFLTPDTFRQGMTNYLTAFSYGNAEQDDLFNQLTLQGHADETLPPEITVKQVMDTWTLQMGYPVITVTRDYAAQTATVAQKRFLIRKSDSSNDTHNYLWWVPLSYTDQTSPNFEDTKPKDWLREETEKTISGLPDENSWILFNVLASGYYRVNYDLRNWELLFAQLESNPEVISTNNRAQILNDLTNLVATNELNITVGLSSTRYLKNELQYVPWHVALGSLTHIKNMFLYSTGFYKFRDYLVNLIENVYNDVTINETPDESMATTFLRIEAVAWACQMDLRNCLLNSLDVYSQWMNEVDPDTTNPISINLKSSIYCNGIKEGTAEEWDFAWERYLAANGDRERNTLLSAMGCSREAWILNRYLDWSIDENSGIRKQDGSRVVSAVSSNPIGQSLAFDFIRNRWDDIVEYQGLNTAASLVATTSTNMNTQLQLDELILFRDAHLDELGSSSTIDSAIQNVQRNIDWMSENYAVIEEWLDTNKPNLKHKVIEHFKKTHL